MVLKQFKFKFNKNNLLIMRMTVPSAVVVLMFVMSCCQRINGQSPVHPVGAAVTECVQKGGQPNDCLKVFFVAITNFFKTGIPEFKLPTLDPLFIGRMDMRMDNPTINGRIVYDRTLMRGLSAWNPYKVTMAPAGVGNKQFVLHFQIRQLRFNGVYEASGNVLGLALTGNSTYFTVMNRYVGNYAMTIRFDQGTNQPVLLGSRLFADPESGRVRFNNMFGGELLGDAVNEMLNMNFALLKPLTMPAVNEKFGQLFENYVKIALQLIPTDAARKLFG